MCSRAALIEKNTQPCMRCTHTVSLICVVLLCVGVSNGELSDFGTTQSPLPKVAASLSNVLCVFCSTTNGALQSCSSSYIHATMVCKCANCWWFKSLFVFAVSMSVCSWSTCCAAPASSCSAHTVCTRLCACRKSLLSAFPIFTRNPMFQTRIPSSTNDGAREASARQACKYKRGS